VLSAAPGSKPEAKQLFGFSIVYLFGIFAALAAHNLWLVHG
jgi:heme O synthase-like polyprenyltransferase